MKKMMMGMVMLFLSATASSVFAYLPRSSTKSIQGRLYGLYTTSDPYCQTGFVATIPLSKTPTTVDFATSPSLGTGSVPSTVNCVALVLSNSFSEEAWKAGSYTTTTPGVLCTNGKGGSNGLCNDSSCNAGGTVALNKGVVCGQCDGAVSTSQKAGDGNCFSMTWPAQIASDMNAAGLKMDAFCGIKTETAIVYISTYSSCTANLIADQAGGDAACITADTNGQSGNPGQVNPMQPPTSLTDPAHGVKLAAAVSNASKYVLYADTNNTVGGCSPSDAACPSNSDPTQPSCGVVSIPIFGFRAARTGE